MGAIFRVSFLILYAVLSQEMVLASEDNLESSFPHIRQKRMYPSPRTQPGNLLLHPLPPLLAYDLRKVKMSAPTMVVITRDGNIIGTGLAIHPYLILARSVYARPQYVVGVSMISRLGGGYIPQRIQHFKLDPTGEFVMIYLKDPIFLDEPKYGFFTASKYPVSATKWAYRSAKQWIPGQLLQLRPVLRQNLNELHLVNPTRVHITSSDRPSPGNGYAVHPYIVITRPEFVGRNVSVLSFMVPTGEPIPHRIQFHHPNRALNVEVLELLDPVLISSGVADALTVEGYSLPAIVWAHYMAEEWRRTRLSQRNYYQQNAALI